MITIHPDGSVEWETDARALQRVTVPPDADYWRRVYLLDVYVKQYAPLLVSDAATTNKYTFHQLAIAILSRHGNAQSEHNQAADFFHQLHDALNPTEKGQST